MLLTTIGFIIICIMRIDNNDSGDNNGNNVDNDNSSSDKGEQ